MAAAAAVVHDLDLLASLEDRVERLEHAAVVAQRYARLVNVVGAISARETQFLGTRASDGSADAAGTMDGAAGADDAAQDEASRAKHVARLAAEDKLLDQLDTALIAPPRRAQRTGTAEAGVDRADDAAALDAQAELDLSWIPALARAVPNACNFHSIPHTATAATTSTDASARETGAAGQAASSTASGSRPRSSPSSHPHSSLSAFRALEARLPKLSATATLLHASDAVHALASAVGAERQAQEGARCESMRLVAQFYAQTVAPLNEVVVRRNASMLMGVRPPSAPRDANTAADD